MRLTSTSTRPLRCSIALFATIAAACLSCTSDPVKSGATTPSSPRPAAHRDPAADPDDIGIAKYAICAGQGGDAHQLAPAFLDAMASCDASDTAPADGLAARGGDGTIIEGKGDCQFAQGISCHFHSSMEFVTTDRLKDDEHHVGEMHCIVPSSSANSPAVFGAHIRCKAGTTPASSTQACSHALLQVLERGNCQQGWKCCDNGTLTKPVARQTPAELKLRPDFRICQDDALEIDCGLLHEMHAHTANVVGLGDEVEGPFLAAHEH